MDASQIGKNAAEMMSLITMKKDVARTEAETNLLASQNKKGGLGRRCDNVDEQLCVRFVSRFDWTGDTGTHGLGEADGGPSDIEGKCGRFGDGR